MFGYFIIGSAIFAEGNGAATRSGSSSLSYVEPPEASALPTWLTAIRFKEQAGHRQQQAGGPESQWRDCHGVTTNRYSPHTITNWPRAGLRP